MAPANHKTGGIDGALRWVGDLDHPFYSDERQRFVWYEASAIGFQLLLLLQCTAIAIAMLVMGYDALPLISIALIPVVVASMLVVSYAGRRGAPYFPGRKDLTRSRGLVGFAIVALYIAGAIRMGFDLPDTDAASSEGFTKGFRDALPIGIGIGVLGLVVGVVLGNKRKAVADELD